MAAEKYLLFAPSAKMQEGQKYRLTPSYEIPLSEFDDLIKKAKATKYMAKSVSMFETRPPTKPKPSFKDLVKKVQAKIKPGKPEPAASAPIEPAEGVNPTYNVLLELPDKQKENRIIVVGQEQFGSGSDPNNMMFVPKSLVESKLRFVGSFFDSD
ncbi:hypothetical protein BDP27DRAFT_1425287 [Rhodocollybia butyracea]|uniref:Uncharacterized protein n=1 Tax=Rhodocollybia butyracea TaxID=206335 RepID=A0A9P5U3J2_9AGAR|nr:hypothetical protein BDP27DRAFT_1425287 [Rhodocollybia butyracea]